MINLSAFPSLSSPAQQPKPAPVAERSSDMIAAASLRKMLRARYDAAQNSPDMAKWWGGADANGPNWTARYSERKKLRERSRYEIANNSYAFGIVQTVALHTIGCGPRLQLTGLVRDWNSRIEQAWHQHAEEINLARKLTSMVAARVYDGESFGVLGWNDMLTTPSKVDMRLIETDQVHDPHTAPMLTPDNMDGVIIDGWGNPVEYRLLKNHPGEHNTLANWEFESWSHNLVCHLFRADRPGQMRGVPELTPALSLFAIIRRFTRATLAAAEAAALFAAFLKTTAASVTPAPNDDPFAAMDLDFGTLTSLPEGWDVTQLKPEHPATTYPQFINQLLQEVARCLSMPPNIALCTSAGYNFSSSKLDGNLYYRRLAVDQQQVTLTVLDKLFRVWFLDSIEHNPALRGIPASYIRERAWYWDPPESIDPQNDAAARDTNLRNGMTTLPIEYAKLGLDWETAQQQQAEALGITVEELRRRTVDSLFPPASVPATSGGSSAPDQSAVGASASAAPAGEYSSITRQQLQRNRKAIDDLLYEMLTGQRSQAFTLSMLQVLGLTADTAQALIDSAIGDGAPDEAQVMTASRMAASAKQKPQIRPGLFDSLRERRSGLILAATAGQKLVAAPSGTATIDNGTAGKPKQATIHAYSGGILHVDGFDEPVVVDLSGVVLHTDQIPYLSDHQEDSAHTLGQSSHVTVGPGGIDSTGLIMGDNEATKNVVSLASKGFRWAVSIGGMVQRPERVPAGQQISVNGRDFIGPLIVARGFVLREISFVPVGADPTASASLAARAAHQGVLPMSFEEWCASCGFDCATLSDQQKAALMTAYQAATAAPAAPAVPAPPVDAAAPVAAAGGCAPDPARPAQAAAATTVLVPSQQHLLTAAARQEWAAEDSRVLRIRRLTAAAETHDGIATIRRQAIEEGWTADRTELAVLRAQGANRAPAVLVQNPDHTPQVLQAALQRGAIGRYEEGQYSEQVLQAAHREFPRGLGLQELLMLQASANGCSVRKINPGNLGQVLRASFSTGSIPGILSNTANKSLLDGYSSVEQTWKRIAYVRPVNDFKSAVAYRLTTDGNFEKVGATGRLKHASFGEESYALQADTYGRLLQINRQMIINDDLSALSDLPRELGRKAGLALNAIFWAAFLNNSTFFTSGNANYVSGGTYVLGAVGLDQAVQTFRKQTDPSGAPLGVEPKLLLVSPENEFTANQLYQSETFNTGGSATTAKVPNKNTFVGKYEPLVSAYLSNSSYTGYSTTAYYLLADPQDMATIQVGFLNGQQEPTVETADADFDQLGIQMRGYFDFGVALMQYRGGVKVAGA